MNNKYISSFNSFNESKLDVLRRHFIRDDKKLAKWIVDNLKIEGDPDDENDALRIIKSVDSYIYYKQLPTMYFFDSPSEDVPNGTWLVHFTDQKKANYILKKGFIYGTTDYLKLGMSWGKYSRDAGYNYAFVPEDCIEKYGSLENACKEWDKVAIFFKSKDAIKNYHFGDDIEQVLFWGSDAYDIKIANGNIDDFYKNIK